MSVIEEILSNLQGLLNDPGIKPLFNTQLTMKGRLRADVFR